MNTNCLCALWCQTRSGDFVADKTCQPSMFCLKDTMGRAISGSYSIIWLVKSAIASRVKTEILLLPLWVWTCGNHPLKINVPPEKKTRLCCYSGNIGYSLTEMTATASNGELKNGCGHLWVIQAQPSRKPPLGQLPGLEFRHGPSLPNHPQVSSFDSPDEFVKWKWLDLTDLIAIALICTLSSVYQFLRLVVLSFVLPMAHVCFVSSTFFFRLDHRMKTVWQSTCAKYKMGWWYTLYTCIVYRCIQRRSGNLNTKFKWWSNGWCSRLSVKRSTHTKQLKPRRRWQTWCVTDVADTKSNWGRVKQLGRMYNLCLHSRQTKHHQAPLTCDFERNMGRFVGWNTALGFWLYLNNKTAPSVGNDYVFLLVILLCPL